MRLYRTLTTRHPIFETLTTGHPIFEADPALTDRVVDAIETLGSAGDMLSDAIDEWLTGRAMEIAGGAPAQDPKERIKRQRARAYDLHVQLLHVLRNVTSAVGIVVDAASLELPGPTAADYDESGQLR